MHKTCGSSWQTKPQCGEGNGAKSYLLQLIGTGDREASFLDYGPREVSDTQVEGHTSTYVCSTNCT